MIILGIDPGTIVTGYGVISVSGRTKIALVETGTIESAQRDAMPKRLAKIFSSLEAIISRTSPDVCAIESVFIDKNVQSILKLGQARGVAIVAAETAGVEVSEYAPRVVKKAVTGNGNASKSQVEFMVRRLLALGSETDHRADAFDALAIAIAHSLRQSGGARAASSWKQFLEANPERIKQR